MDASASAKVGVVVLRVISGVSVAATLIGNYLYIFGRNEPDGAAFDTITSDRFTFGQFLASVATPLAFAGIVLALSFVVSIYAARLDLDIVLADEQEVESRGDVTDA
jgi:hypothetical protein